MSQEYATICLLCILGSFKVIRGSEDSCRNVIFKQPINDKAFIGHVIINKTVIDKKQCEIACYMEPNCVSLNFNTKAKSSPNCQLSSSDDSVHSDRLAVMSGYIYHPMVNKCIGRTCSHPETTCQTGYGLKGYRCDCSKPCMTGEHCEKYKRDVILTFPRKTISQKVVYDKPFQSISAFTISMWIQTDPSTKSHSYISYATEHSSNEIYFLISRNLGMLVFSRRNKITRSGVPFSTVSDGKWHHVTATWESSSGQAIIYFDGAEVKKNTVETRNVIPEGALVIGQDQDAYLGGYDQNQSFQGNITGVNMWDKALSSHKISQLAKTCPTTEVGNIVSWQDLASRKTASVGYFCGHSCDL